jgi:hypothetical protein
MDIDTFQHELHAKAEEIRALIVSAMPSKGDCENDCQRLYVLNRLDALCYSFNGIEASDLTPDDHSND